MQNTRGLLSRDYELVKLYLLENEDVPDRAKDKNALMSTMLNSHLRSDCVISLYHDVFKTDNWPGIQLPPVSAVYVQTSFDSNSSPCSCDPPKTILHSARKLRLSAAGRNAALCGFARNMFTPTVEDLTVGVDHPDKASGFFQAVENKRRSGSLRVTVKCSPTVPQELMKQCSEKWSVMLDRPVTVRHG